MPNHPPKTYSHEDVLFLVETLKNLDGLAMDIQLKLGPQYRKHNAARKDIDRCIKILEKDNE